MPQSLTQKANTTFIKGLITEAGPLTFPPDASVDELNCSLERDGSRTRRLAVEYESGYTLSDNAYTPNLLVHTGTWSNVGGVAGREFTVVQIDSTLFFYNKSANPLSGEAVPVSTSDSTVYELDLSTHERTASLLGAGSAKVELASINGNLVVASNELNTFYISRDDTTEAFSTTEITFRVRDFEWQGDRTTYSDQGAPTVPIGRQYDTINTGWASTAGSSTDGEAALATYIAANSSNYPPLTHPWYSGKTAAGAFAVADWEKVYSGSSILANGHFILDLYTKDRDTASGLTGVTASPEATRFKTVATYADRIFYAGLESRANGTKIYFSQLVETEQELGECFQVSDPTSEEISDLLDTDGGYVSIHGCHNIKRLHTMGSILLVFAENGVWSIGGVDDIFRATGFSVNKLTEVGIVNSHSFVSAEGRPYWWSATGIHTLAPDDVTGALREQNISLPTIQTFWNEIPSEGKNGCIGKYDELNRQVFWIYPSDGETTASKLNEVLVLDEVLQAFYPWTIADKASSTNYVVGLSFYRGTNAGTVDYTVVDENGNEVVDGSGNTVIAQETLANFTSDSVIKLLVWDGATNKVTFAGFTGTDFLDWGDANYSSYAEAGHDFLGDMTLKKNAPFITVYMRTTETGWTGSEVLGYTPIRPSSLKVSSYWDFKTTTSSTAQQAYRFKSMPVVDPNDLTTFGYPNTVIATRLKMRGRGRSMRVRFESEEGKDFNLLGWEVIGARNGSL
jgi:hypothetical protein